MTEPVPASKPIPSLRPIPRSKWEIALPNLKKPFPGARPVLSSTSTDLDYAQACKELGQLGFVKLYSVDSVSHWSLRYWSENDRSRAVHRNELWHHPAGVLITTKARQDRSNDETQESSDLVMESIEIHYQLELGTGTEFAHLGAVKIRSSGSSSIEFDATSRKQGSAYATGGSDSVISFLETCQKYGRFLPVDKWKTDEHFIHIPDEVLFPVMDPKPWAGRDIQKEIKSSPGMLDEGKRRLKEALPEDVFSVLDSSWQDRDRIDPSSAPGPAVKEDRFKTEWISVEYALRQASEVLFLSGQRFPTQSVRDLIRHWVEVAKGWHGEDPAHWRVDEPGPGGLSLATILLFTQSQASHRRLLRFIEHSSVDTVKEWTTQPDESGYVLPQRLLARAFVGSSVEDLEGLEANLGEVFDSLLKKVGPEHMGLGTPFRSGLGVWVEKLTGTSDHERQALKGREAVASRLLLKMAHAGVEWKAPLRWRTYPNVFLSTDKIPRFKSLGDQAPTPDQLEDLLGPDIAGVSVARQLLARELDTKLPPPRAPRRMSRF